ncbi:MAG: class I SAM-dependent methyltransferase [Planctomycetota bacterium]
MLLARLFAEGQRIYDARSDLRQRFASPAGLDYWVWLMSDGLRQHPEVAALVPVPPLELIGNVVSAQAGIEFFQESGLSEARQLFTLLAEGGFTLTSGGKLLDFGCGCARILRFMARLADTVQLHGADPDEKAIAWCRANLDYAHFEQLSAWPPSPYPDNTFRAVYAYSVFTHLDEKLHRAWLEDLHRVTEPGAALVLTTAGRRCVDEILGPRAREFTFPTGDELRAAKPRLEAGEYAFFPYDFEVSSLPAEMAPRYGMTFFYPSYIRRHWTDLFEVVAAHEGPSGWQDYIVLRRR